MSDQESPFGWYVFRLLLEAENVTKTWRRVGPAWTRSQQIRKMLEEVHEVDDAWLSREGKDRIAEEISDVIFAALTFGHLSGITAEEMQHAMRGKLRVIQERANDAVFLKHGERPY